MKFFGSNKPEPQPSPLTYAETVEALEEVASSLRRRHSFNESDGLAYEVGCALADVAAHLRANRAA